jgi:large subunit ribosomal protein L25
MSRNVFEFVAERREKAGKNASRGIRRAGNVPAIMYGNGEPEMLVLSHNEVLKHLSHEEVYSHILDVTVDGKTEKAILKAVQRHPAKPKILHLDFQRINLADRIKVHVPLHFINEQASAGVKKGGIANHILTDVEIICLPSALPDFLEINLAKLEIGESLHLSDIKTPSGVEIVALSHGDEHNLAVVSIVPPTAATE